MTDFSNKDKIIIENLEVFAHHGVFPEEKRDGQSFFVNAVCYTDLRAAGLSDDLEKSTNYGEICHYITELMTENTYDLIESVAETVAGGILKKFDLIEAVDLEIRKPSAPIGLPFESVSVKIHRAWHQVYLSIGSNMGDRAAYIDKGIDSLKAEPSIKQVEVSDIIETKPYGYTDQPVFLNGAIGLKTLLQPRELLDKLHEIEASANRERKIHWGPRTLDLDILLYDKLIYEDKDLIIPHIDMENRYFVLQPLNQLAPYLRHPISGKTMAQLLSEIK